MKQHGGMRIYLDKSFVWTLCTFRRRLNVFPPLGFLVAVGRAIGGSHKIPRCITCCATDCVAPVGITETLGADHGYRPQCCSGSSPLFLSNGGPHDELQSGPPAG
jgi:hypothetical protein